MYENDFGRIDMSEIPEKYRPGPNALDRECEAMFSAGGDLTGKSDLVVQEEHDESGKTGRTIVYVRVYFAGSFMHEVAREKIAQ